MLGELKGAEKLDGADGTLGIFGDVVIAGDSRGALGTDTLLRFDGAENPGVEIAGLDSPGEGVSISLVGIAGLEISGADASLVGIAGLEISGADASLVGIAGLEISGADISLVGIAGLEISGADISLVGIAGLEISGTEVSPVVIA
jgi:hypothetical protein